MEDQKEFWEVLIVGKGGFVTVIDEITKEQAEKLAGKLHELGHKRVLTQKYYLD